VDSVVVDDIPTTYVMVADPIDQFGQLTDDPPRRAKASTAQVKRKAYPLDLQIRVLFTELRVSYQGIARYDTAGKLLAVPSDDRANRLPYRARHHG
jgi:hypothetical protein